MSNSSHTEDVWGHRFRWSTLHQTESQMRSLLYSYDRVATNAVERLIEISPPTMNSCPFPHDTNDGGNGDLYSLLRSHASSDHILGALWNEVTTIPDWVDWKQIERGQQVVYQFSGQVMLGVRSHSNDLLQEGDQLTIAVSSYTNLLLVEWVLLEL